MIPAQDPLLPERVVPLPGRAVIAMPVPPDFTLHTHRCRLRPPTEADFPDVWSASRVPGFNDGMRWDPPAELAELETSLARTRQWRADGHAFQFTVEDRSDGRFLARIVIRRTAEPKVWNIGFWTHPREQRRGYMTEAAARILDFGFDDLDADRIEADHAVWNRASERLLHKLGLSFLEHLPHGFQKHGRWVEENRLGITRAEWTMRRDRHEPGDAGPATPAS